LKGALRSCNTARLSALTYLHYFPVARFRNSSYNILVRIMKSDAKIMGKTDQKSKKKGRSISSNQLASLEEKMSHLIDILTYNEVRTPFSIPIEVFFACTSGRPGVTHGKTGFVYSTKSDSNNTNLPSLARQAEPRDPQGVYDCWICICEIQAA